MVIQNELVGPDGMVCKYCDAELELSVCESGAGFYIGYHCENDGPMGRETGYFSNRETADFFLQMYHDEKILVGKR